MKENIKKMFENQNRVDLAEEYDTDEVRAFASSLGFERINTLEKYGYVVEYSRYEKVR